MRRVIYLWLPFLATDRLATESRSGQNAGQNDVAQARGERAAPRPLATLTQQDGQMLLAAADPVALAAGLEPGMRFADARALCPDLRTVESDPGSEDRTLAALADWCDRYTPWISLDTDRAGGSGGLWLDVTGCAHLFQGEQALLTDLLSRMRGFGYQARAALAGTAGAVWALARFDPCSAASEGLLAAEGEEESLLAPLPVAALRVAPDHVAALDRLGLRRVGDLAAMSARSLTERFGPDLVRSRARALGEEAEPLAPRRPVPAFHTRLSFAEPVGRREDIAAGLRQMLAVLCKRMERQGRGARRLELVLYYSDGRVRRTSAGTCRPNRDLQALERLFDDRLDSLESGGRNRATSLDSFIETMVLVAPVTETLDAEQLAADGLLTMPGQSKSQHKPLSRRAESDIIRTSTRGGARDMGELADRLANNGKGCSLHRLTARDSALPERASRLESLDSLPRGKKRMSASARAPEQLQALQEEGALPDSLPEIAPPLEGRVRPVRLLPRPEPVDTVSTLPDRPPVMFRWRHRLYRVRHADGPERIAPEWWRDLDRLAPADQESRVSGEQKDQADSSDQEALLSGQAADVARILEEGGRTARDYYQVEDLEGGRYWLYSDGPVGAAEPKWYLHGLFG